MLEAQDQVMAALDPEMAALVRVGRDRRRRPPAHLGPRRVRGRRRRPEARCPDRGRDAGAPREHRQPAGPPRGRRDRGPRRDDPPGVRRRDRGHLRHGGGLDRLEREAAAGRRAGVPGDPRVPGRPCRLLPGGGRAGAQAARRPADRCHPGRAGAGGARGRQAHRRDRHRDAGRRPGRARAGVLAPVRLRQGPGQHARLDRPQPRRGSGRDGPVARAGRSGGRRHPRHRRTDAVRVRGRRHPRSNAHPGRRAARSPRRAARW